MYDPSTILAWIEANVEGMRRSRLKTLASIVSAALLMKGGGVLALGRAVAEQVAARHCIKRVWRFLRNGQVEAEGLSAALFRFLRPPTGRTIGLADWTDLAPFQQRVFSLPRDGRALPFLCVTIRKGTSESEQEGAMVAAEKHALDLLARICPPEVKPIVVADRGSGHARWPGEIQKRGWGFVQRLSHIHHVCVEHHMGTLKELGIRRGWRSRDWGWGTMDEQEFGPVRLITVFDREAEEAWYLVTNLEAECPAEIVRIYKRRMWIEAMFRDLKNCDWGSGLDLDAIFSVQHIGTVTHDYTYQYQNERYQILPGSIDAGLRRAKIIIENRLDGTQRVRWRKRYLRLKKIESKPVKKVARPVGATPVGLRPPRAATTGKHKPVPDHPWRRSRRPDTSTLQKTGHF